MINETTEEMKLEMDQSIESFQNELSKRRTGRANVAMLDGVRVDYYGSKSPLNQVAAVQVADARLITVKPWDKGMLVPIEKALQQASLGLNPSSDGEIIRIPIPPLTGERRKDLVKDVKKVGEDAKVSVRNHRRDANEKLKQIEKDKEISEDDLHRALASVQEITDGYIKKVDELLATKEREILED